MNPQKVRPSVVDTRLDATRQVEGHLRVPFHPSSAAVARRQLRLWLTRHGAGTRVPDFEDLVDCAELVVSELVGNAIRHAQPVQGGVLTLCWSLSPDGLVVSVTDGGSALVPHRVDAPPSAQSGRGMAIVDSLTKRWWTELTAERATVHALIAPG
ncbi:ATP-binding protein [Nocardioidaceae bacterium]|nr:ATP-binding protein [Nocardioidaceae bacterium]